MQAKYFWQIKFIIYINNIMLKILKLVFQYFLLCLSCENSDTTCFELINSLGHFDILSLSTLMHRCIITIYYAYMQAQLDVSLVRSTDVEDWIKFIFF